MPGGGRTARIRAPAAGARHDRRGLRRLARERAGRCAGTRAGRPARRPGFGLRGRPRAAVRARRLGPAARDRRARRAGSPAHRRGSAASRPVRRRRRTTTRSEALARYAESVDLLVLGSHAYRPTDSLLAGSTAQRLAVQAPCPLLVLARDRVPTGRLTAPASASTSCGDPSLRGRDRRPERARRRPASADRRPAPAGALLLARRSRSSEAAAIAWSRHSAFPRPRCVPFRGPATRPPRGGSTPTASPSPSRCAATSTRTAPAGEAAFRLRPLEVRVVITGTTC